MIVGLLLYSATKFNFVFIIYSLLFVLVYAIISIAYKIVRHKNILSYTLKFGSRFTGKYDWKKILKEKSFSELKDIAEGKTILSKEVQKLAQQELIKRPLKEY